MPLLEAANQCGDAQKVSLYQSQTFITSQQTFRRELVMLRPNTCPFYNSLPIERSLDEFPLIIDSPSNGRMFCLDERQMDWLGDSMKAAAWFSRRSKSSLFFA